MIADLAALEAFLADVHTRRMPDVRCELAPALSARMSDAALSEVLLLGLPMAQGVQLRILRSRGRGITLTAKIRYRQGVRMLSGVVLTKEESAALVMARSIVADFLPLDAEERFRRVYEWVCTHVRYIHTSPGQKGYERLVCASGALLDGQANCQGFADAMYLMCGLADIPCEYRIDRGARRLHVWNVVRLGGEWRDADASKGARNLAD